MTARTRTETMPVTRATVPEGGEVDRAGTRSARVSSTAGVPSTARAPSTAVTQRPAAVDRRERVRFLGGPFARRTWLEFGYLWCALLLMPLGFTYVILTISLAAGLAVTVVGLFVCGWLVVGGRAWGRLYRSMARAMLAVDVPAPVDLRAGKGFWRGLRNVLLDGAGWRALAFLLLSAPVALAGLVVSVVFLAVPLGTFTYGYWYRFLPLQEGADGTWHRGSSVNAEWFVDTPARIVGQALVGLALLLVWPPLTRAFAHVMRLLTINLLGPTASSVRVADVELARTRTVQDADVRLRRIERDLHDGTQARLVAIAMQLGEAKEQLASGDRGTLTRELVGSAHASTKEAIIELRELVRGIHPAALDNGLAVALESLAARSPVPVTVDADLDVVVDAAVEAIAYFCVTELLTNVAKHARATGAYVLVDQHGGALRVRVRDDGRGGAAVGVADDEGHGSGLAGLTERVRAVDGTLDVVSPPGGPTVATVTLPLRVP